MANTVTLGERNITIVPGTVALSTMTTANPCVVTWATHGLVTGDRVSFSGIAQADWVALNGNSYVITKVNANTFSVLFNASALAAYVAADNPDGMVGHDFQVTDYFTNGIMLSAVDFRPSYKNDRLVMRTKSVTGTVFFDRSDPDGGGIHQRVGGRPLSRKVVIKFGEQIWDTPSSVRIMLEFD